MKEIEYVFSCKEAQRIVGCNICDDFNVKRCNKCADECCEDDTRTCPYCFNDTYRPNGLDYLCCECLFSELIEDMD